jgi:squalene-hopene/tetraprenyl-beta-curcumene cyclase
MKASALFLALVITRASSASAGEAAPVWNPAGAAKYLDDRGQEWFAYTGADRGEGATKTSCISCHTALPFALGRPALRKLSGESAPTALEKRALTQTKMRVDHWAEIDSPPYHLFYDSKEDKRKQSWGTEAILNAFILAADDRATGHNHPGDPTQRAFANLWQTQVSEGAEAGSWEWLNFGNDPFESINSRYFGAAMAAIAVGTAYGHDYQDSDPDIARKTDLLRRYLKARLARQNLHNRAWVLWAGARLDGVLTTQEQQQIIDELLARQEADGGWRLASLGKYVRHDGTPQDPGSDGYATGLVLYTLQLAKVPRTNPKIANGLKWLVANQQATGEWRTSSVNKQRDPTTNVGKFMSDAATGYAVLALTAE